MANIGLNLQGENAQSLSLRILGFQYGAQEALRRQDDCDARWLVVEGKVDEGFGHTYSFRGALIDTFEALQLNKWLLQIGESPSLVETPLTFTEPAISFAFLGSRHGTVGLRVHLYDIARPVEDFDFNFFSYYLDFWIHKKELERTQRAWERNIQEFL